MRKRLLRRVLNRILHHLARIAPGATSLRPFLHKLRGVKIHGRVFIGDEVYLENEYPERVEMHDQSSLNLRSTVIAHFRGPGRIIFMEKARVAACCTLVCSPGRVLTIGEGAFVAAGSLVKRDVPPYTLVAGVPAKPIARITVPAVPGVSYDAFKRGLRPLPNVRPVPSTDEVTDQNQDWFGDDWATEKDCPSTELPSELLARPPKH